MIISTVLMDNSFEDRSEKERYDILKRIWQSDRYGVTQSDLCIAPFDRAKSLVNRDLRKWLSWVNLNVCLPIADDTEKTFGVKLRIATGMLNKIASISDIEKIQIHSNLVDNLYEERFLIINGELPF